MKGQRALYLPLHLEYTTGSHSEYLVIRFK
jgi:hypothetical protein